MAQSTPPEAYGWIAAGVLALIGALKLAISKITGGRSDPLSEVLQRDIANMQKLLEVIHTEAKEDREILHNLVTRITVVEARLERNGHK